MTQKTTLFSCYNALQNKLTSSGYLEEKSSLHTFRFANGYFSTLKAIGYIGINGDKQDLERQENLLLKYAQQHDLQVDEYIKVEISSRKNMQERHIAGEWRLRGVRSCLICGRLKDLD